MRGNEAATHQVVKGKRLARYFKITYQNWHGFNNIREVAKYKKGGSQVRYQKRGARKLLRKKGEGGAHTKTKMYLTNFLFVTEFEVFYSKL